MLEIDLGGTPAQYDALPYGGAFLHKYGFLKYSKHYSKSVGASSANDGIVQKRRDVIKYIYLKSVMLFRAADITKIYGDTMLWSETMPKYLDLFAGAGGLSEGFIRAGYEPVAHVEMDAAACYSLKTRAAYHWLKKQNKLRLYERYLNQEITRERFYQHIPEYVLNTVLNYEISDDNLEKIFSDIDRFLGGETLDLIVGGPPCQAYSIAGRSRSENRMVGDKRNYLYNKLYI